MSERGLPATCWQEVVERTVHPDGDLIHAPA